MNIIIAIIAFIVGSAVVWFYKSGDTKALEVKLQEQKRHDEAEINRLNNQIALDREKAEEAISEERDKAESRIAEERRRAAEDIENERRHSEQLIEQINKERANERRAEEERRAESDRLWQSKLEAIKQEFMQATTDQMIKGNEQLQKTNTASIDRLMQPVKEEFEKFRKQLEETKTETTVSKNEIQNKFESTMELFQRQQEFTVKQLLEATSKIGNDAVNLAQALKGNTKRQGNWGEMVLATLLENSGLEEDKHFFLQYSVIDEEGKRNIPDVVVKFPEGRTLVIDSKVSLTAYTQYFETDDEDRREGLLKAHLASVEKHIDELSKKKYPELVENAMDYVMMFIPNESSYVAAMKLNPNLMHEAYKKKVFVVSPNNLMMALTLAYIMWQNDKQIKNVEKIVDRGRLLYDKVYNFQESFLAIGDQISKLDATFKKAGAQLSSGNGSVLRQCEMLRKMGVRTDPKKRLKIDDDSLLPAGDDTDDTDALES